MEKGSVEGGYFATVTGTLNPSPLWRTNGMVGTIDLVVAIRPPAPAPALPPTGPRCTSPAASVSLDWWGWIYHGGRFVKWVNSADGSSGTIGQSKTRSGVRFQQETALGESDGDDADVRRLVSPPRRKSVSGASDPT